MKNPVHYFKRSLSTRLSLWIVLFAAVIFLIALGFMFFESRQAVRQEAINHATQILENTAERVNTILTKVEVATDNTDWLAARHLDAADSMYVYSRRILQNNPDLNGCSIAFEPYFFKDRGRYFSAFSLNQNGVIKTTQEGNEHYEYFSMDWYQLPKLLDKPCWTEPFLDYNPDDIYSTDRIISYCKPIKDGKGQFVGTISVDLSLDWLSKTISAVKPYPHSYSIMIGQSGTYFVHPDTTKLFYQSIFTPMMKHVRADGTNGTLMLEEPDTTLTALGHAMQHGEEGMRELSVDGVKSYVFYKPLSNTGWSVAIVCPESDIYGGYNRLQSMVAFIAFIGLLIMLFMFRRIVGKELRPLENLASQTEAIASGNFEMALPVDGRTDEIGQLTQSFDNMQRSLVKYIDELKSSANTQNGLVGL